MKRESTIASSFGLRARPMMQCTSERSHQLMMRWRQSPESPRKMMRTSGQTWTPDLAQPAHQQLEDGGAVLLQHVQRQVAVAVAVFCQKTAVEEAALLLAVQRVVGGVKVQHQLLGCGVEAGHELLDQQLAQAHRCGSISPALQAAQRGGTGHFAIHANGRLHRHVQAQRLVVVQVFPPQRQAVHALAQHVAHSVLDQQRVA